MTCTLVLRARALSQTSKNDLQETGSLGLLNLEHITRLFLYRT